MVSLYPYVAGSAWAMIATGIATVIATSLITAPYGKFMQSKGWGIMIPAKIAWLIMESPNVWMLIVLSASLPKSEVQSSLLWSSLPHQVFAGLFLLHYIHRDIIFPLFLSRGNPMPFTVMFLAFSYCSWNSFNQFMYLLFFMNYPADYLASPRALGGISLFFIGMFINMHSDYSLLFQKQQKASGPSKYIIPRGFLYEWLSCPNYFGEIVEWLGFAICCNSLAAWSFAFYTPCALVTRALAHHRWYQTKFEDYPKHRKAVIPFAL